MMSAHYIIKVKVSEFNYWKRKKIPLMSSYYSYFYNYYYFKIFIHYNYVDDVYM